MILEVSRDNNNLHHRREILMRNWLQNEPRDWPPRADLAYEMEELRYFVEQMDIRDKSPSLFRAFGFRPLVEKCSVCAARSHLAARIDPLVARRTVFLSFPFSMRIFRMRSAARRAEIVDFQSHRESYSIIDWLRLVTRERTQLQKNMSFFLQAFSVCFRDVFRSVGPAARRSRDSRDPFVFIRWWETL